MSQKVPVQLAGQITNEEFLKMKNNRRAFLRFLGSAVITLPLSNLVIQELAFAAQGDKLDPDDSAARSLAYTHESSDTARPCDRCQFYTGVGDSEWGPCVIFPGKLVNAQGVCNSWYAKS